ncbi:TolC family protein [Phocaeicola oris]|uniref:TolC family protein n=1 Tax=Phocaeicola oris TaxID=2896850 RepID=UPI00234EA242|nr:TolC family protein [Phocaeicola oris]MCE2616240.1 TolC family protein [Phocaeicola oris]
MKKPFLLILAVVSVIPTFAQEEWTLTKCIDYALEHNLTIKQQEATRDSRKVDVNTAKWRRLPNLSGDVNQSFNFGRGLQVDNTYADRNTRSFSVSLGTNVPLFTGLEIPNSIALSKLNLQAAIEDLNKAKEDVSIQVTSYYLQVLYTEELAKIAHSQLELSKEQLDSKIEFFKNGKAAEAEVYEAKSRVAQDELSAIQADNNYNLAVLDLTQILELPSPEGFKVVAPTKEYSFETLALPEAIYNEALTFKPSIKAAQYRLEGADRSIKIAQSALYPQLNLQAGLGTNYYNVSGIKNISFADQWSQNFARYIGVSLSIPIFNRFQTRNNIRKARIDKTNLTWQLEESKKTLYKEIQQAYYNAVAAESKYKSSQTASEAAEASFNLIKVKYQEGKANATEYNESRTNWMKAVSDLAQAKYEYLFRTKILDFYKGTPIALK